MNYLPEHKENWRRRMSRGYRENEGPTVELSVLLKHRTDNAILIYDHASDMEHWIPLSQCPEIHHNPKTGEATIRITEWIARQKGLIK